MRITYIHQHFVLPDEPGGSRPWEFSRRLARNGHRVTMICGGPEGLRTTREGVEIIRLPIPYSNSMGFVSRILSFARFMVSATWVAAKTPADLVFASSTPLTVAVPGMIAALVRRRPFVFEVRDLWPGVPVELGLLTNRAMIAVARALEKLTYRQSRSVIALSPSMADGVREVHPDANVHLVPNSADVELFRVSADERRKLRAGFDWGDDELVLAYCGSFGRSYDLEWTVRVAAELKDDPVRVVLVGEGATTDDLTALCKTLGLDPAAILWGSRPKSEVAKIVSAADVVVSTLIDHPALEGNSLNKVFDAMAAGRPVLFNHRGWLGGTMADKGAGWLASREPASAASLIRTLVSERETVEESAAQSAALGDAQFSRDHLFSVFEEVLLRAASSHPSRRPHGLTWLRRRRGNTYKRQS
ncbi:glycosyltransferase family 4 protein [Brachybacterium sp. UMB0905]|uniref:glycosyltransferase family 4 protein n=1 Tax=Brachybacterium sp. UMB0905 TaxID=2069310 RepID=UPI000C7FB01B|nr:glycosyltransferase family 4 protein [Brachybacterium sp. UMB0905]PMC74771.1 glycosyltransferase WbuB [Brachybacterium sp. UMB0905]